MPSRTALLVMDVQVGIVTRYGDDAALLDRIAQAVRAARAAGMKVVFVRVALREGYPDVSPSNKAMATIANGSRDFVETEPSTVIHPRLAPEACDIVVTKRRVSAFSGSDLDVVLRAAQVDTLVLAGIATSGVVLSTVRQAADLDFNLVVLGDACIDSDAEVHRVLMDKVFPRQCEVLSVDAWAKQLVLE